MRIFVNSYRQVGPNERKLSSTLEKNWSSFKSMIANESNVSRIQGLRKGGGGLGGLKPPTFWG